MSCDTKWEILIKLKRSIGSFNQGVSKALNNQYSTVPSKKSYYYVLILVQNCTCTCTCCYFNLGLM